MDLTKPIAAQSDAFESWSESLRDYCDADANVDTISEEAYQQVNMAFLDVQNKIFEFFLKNSRVLDNWESPPRVSIFPFGQEILCRSLKQQEDYQFGIYENEYYLETYISNPQNIKYMPNEFWSVMSEIEQYGTFAFQENASPIYEGDDHPKPELLRAARSNIYKLIRNCIFLEQWSDESICDLGWLKVSWPCNTSWEFLLNFGTHAFRCLHRLNYMLYRYEYKRRKAQRKRFTMEA